jgi:hypothetical protein
MIIMVMRMHKAARQLGLTVILQLLILVLVQCVCVRAFVVVPTTLECSRAQRTQNHPGFSLSNQQQQQQQQLQVRQASSSLSAASEDAATSSIVGNGEERSPEESSSLWDALLDRFQGDFDNYQQVVADRAAGLLPQTGGGHEHIHCCLVPVSTDARLAAFYFDGQPGAIFRFRYYHLVPTSTDLSGDGVASSPSSALPLVDTVLYTLHPDLEKELRKCPDPLDWPNLYHNFSPPSSSSSADPDNPKITLLEACDVRWSWERDPIQHAYAAAAEIERGNNDNGIHAVMVHGNATVQSQMMPGQDILIKDQLSLWRDSLWIHDRGYNPDTGAFIYGNQRGVPYRLQRVTSMEEKEGEQQQQQQQQEPISQRRVVVDPSLAWTLGPDFRTPQEYEENMAVIGGSSRPAR